jgi:hypothetical protein
MYAGYRDNREEIRTLRKESNIRKHLATRSAPAVVRMRRTVLEEIEYAEKGGRLRGMIDMGAVFITILSAIGTAVLCRATYDLMLYVNTGADHAFVSTLGVGFMAFLAGAFTCVLVTQIPNHVWMRVKSRIEAWRLKRLYRIIEAQRVAYLADFRQREPTPHVVDRIKELELE